MTNQSEEILAYIKSHPHCSIENIVNGTGWNRHLVEVTTRLMVEQGLIREMGQTDWLDFKYEAIPTKMEQITAQIEMFVDKINQDLQISSPSNLFSNTSLPDMTKGLMGFGLVKSLPSLTSMVTESIEQNQLLEEIILMTGKTRDEIVELVQSHPYSLEFIKNILMMGAELNEESINRTLAQTSWIPLGNLQVADFLGGNIMESYTFIVTLPNNDRREIKAHYMEVTSNGVLYFEDEDERTILTFAPGYWVWATRKEEGDE